MLDKFKLWFFRISIALVAVVRAYAKGRQDSYKRLKQDEIERKNKATQKAKAIRDEVNSLDDDELISRASEWVRDSKRR